MDYYLRPEMSQSRLKEMSRSPGHLKYSIDHPMKKTREMELGTATHYHIMEPEEYASRYFVIKGKFSKATKAGKKIYQDALEANPGKILLKESEEEQVVGCSKVAHNHDHMGFILKNPIEVEQEVYFDLFGVHFKAKLDITAPELGALIDVKTAFEGGYEQFLRVAFKRSKMYHYDIQLYVYAEAYKAKYGQYPRSCCIAFLDKQAPYSLDLIEVDDVFLDSGRYWTMKYIDKYKECLEKNYWPTNASNETIKLTSPDWAVRELMENGEAYFSTMIRE